MTRALEHMNAGTPFGKWMRESLKDSKFGLNISDIDTTVYVMWDYVNKVLYLLEEKANGDTIHAGQGFLLGTLNSILAHGCKSMGITYNGIHVIRMEKYRPDESEWLTLDGMAITEQELVENLNALTQKRNGNGRALLTPHP